MKTAIALIGLILVLLSANLWIYNKGLVDGKIRYQHSKNMQLTLDAAYTFGLQDGEKLGFYEGYVYWQQHWKEAFKKLSRKEKRGLCK